MSEIINKIEEAIQQEGESFLLYYPWAKLIPPEKKDKQVGGTIQRWVLSDYTVDGGTVQMIRGTVYDDPRYQFPDGSSIRTSYIVDMEYNEDTKSGWVETRNTVYVLGNKLESMF